MSSEKPARKPAKKQKKSETEPLPPGSEPLPLGSEPLTLSSEPIQTPFPGLLSPERSSCDSSLDCPHCGKLFDNPFRLSCGHNVCQKCVIELSEDYLTALVSKKDHSDTEITTDKLRCPVCGEIVVGTNSEENKALGGILKMMSDAFEKCCKVGCSGRAEVCCLDCPCGGTEVCSVYCKACFEEKHAWGPQMNHRSIELGKSTKEEAIKKTASQSSVFSFNGELNITGEYAKQLPCCRVHKRPALFYCKEKGTFLCKICKYEADRDSTSEDLIPIEGLVFESKTSIPFLLRTMMERVCCVFGKQNAEALCKKKLPDEVNMGKTQEVLRGLVEMFRRMKDGNGAKKEEDIREVNAQFDGLIARLNQLRDTTITTVKEYYDKEGMKMERYFDEAESVLSEFESLVEFVNKYQGQDDFNAFMIEKRLEMLAERIEALFSYVGEDGNAVRTMEVTVNHDEGLNVDEFVTVSRRFEDWGAGHDGVIPFVPIRDLDSLCRTEPRKGFKTPTKTSHDGGAIFDRRRRIVVSTCGKDSNGKNVTIIQLEDGKDVTKESKVIKGLIPFSTHGQYPVFDGKTYVYFFQSQEAPNNRFGRMNMNDFSFEELDSLPDGKFAQFCCGCFSNGCVFILDESFDLCCFDPKEKKWSKVAVGDVKGKGCLLSDPMDKEGVYGLFSDRVLRRIGLDGESQHISNFPEEFDLRGNSLAVFVRVSEEEAYIIAQFSDHFCAYSFKEKEWKPLEKWPMARNRSGQIVVDPLTGCVYYHSDDCGYFHSVKIA